MATGKPRMEALQRAEAYANRARAEEHDGGNPTIAAENFIAAAELVALAVHGLPCASPESRDCVLLACSRIVSQYTQRAELMLSIAAEVAAAAAEDGSAAAVATPATLAAEAIQPPSTQLPPAGREQNARGPIHGDPFGEHAMHAATTDNTPTANFDAVYAAFVANGADSRQHFGAS